MRLLNLAPGGRCLLCPLLYPALDVSDSYARVTVMFFWNRFWTGRTIFSSWSPCSRCSPTGPRTETSFWATRFTFLRKKTNSDWKVQTTPAISAGRNSRLNVPQRPTNDYDSKNSAPLFRLGQMIYMDNWQMMMYLGTPVMPDLNALVTTGLYINDLSMHDFSRFVVGIIFGATITIAIGKFLSV